MSKGKSNTSYSTNNGKPAADNKSNQGNPTSPVYYQGRGIPVPSSLPTSPKPQDK